MVDAPDVAAPGTRRPAVVLAAISLLVFVGLTALAGGIELILIPKRSVIEALYGGIAVALIWLPRTRSARLYLSL